MRYTRENIVEGINAKLDELYCGSETSATMKSIYSKSLLDYPIEIEQNILEWVNDEPFTYVDCHGISIKEIVDDLSLSKYKIPRLIKNFINFKACGFVGPAICYRGL